MNFESPEMAKEFPGLYNTAQGEKKSGLSARMLAVTEHAHHASDEEEEGKGRRKESGWRKEGKQGRRDKGYRMFEEENSEEETLVSEEYSRSPSKMKKHSKPSFKFAKRDKFYKPKEKDKDEKKDKEKKEKEEKKKEEKLKWKKKKITLAPKPEQAAEPDPDYVPVFGVPLRVSVERCRSHDGIQLPAIFRECIDYVEEFGLACEGIYRISGVKSKVQALKDAYNHCVPVYLHEHEPNIVASLLKQFLRELPDPILTSELMPKFEEASTIKNVKQKVESFQQLIEVLPTPNKLLLSWMIVHMTHIIAREKQNKMSLQNVSIVLSPTMQISHRVLNVLFTYSKILFRDTVIKRYVPPLKPVTSLWSLELPESPSALEEELHKQESLLGQLHEALMKGNDTEKEEQLWEVQRVVTQLKRKLKNARKAAEANAASEFRQHEIIAGKREQQRNPQEEDIRVELKQPSPEIKPKSQSVKPVNAEEESDECSTEEDRDKTPVNEIDDEPSVAFEKTLDAASETKPSEDVVKVPQPDVVKVPQPATLDSQVEISEPLQACEPEFDEVAAAEDEPSAAEAKPDAETSLPVDDDVKESLEIKEQTDSEDVEKVIDTNKVAQETVRKVSEASELSEVSELSEASDTSEGEVVKPEPTAMDTTEVDTTEKEEVVETEPQAVSADDAPVVVVEPEVEVYTCSSDEDLTPTRERIEMLAIATIAKDQQKSPVVSAASSEQRIYDTTTSEDGAVTADSDLDEKDDDELQHIHSTLQLEEEELLAIGDELHQKIETERSEIERLHQEIVELQAIRQELYDSDEASSESSYGSEDEDELQEILQQLMQENAALEEQNADLCTKTHEERQACLEVKIQIGMIQQRQLDSSQGIDALLM